MLLETQFCKNIIKLSRLIPFPGHFVCCSCLILLFYKINRVLVHILNVNSQHRSFLAKHVCFPAVGAEEYVHIYIYIYIYRVSQEECARLREGVPYVKVYRYNPKHLCPKFNGYGDNGQRKVWSSCAYTHSYPPVQTLLS